MNFLTRLIQRHLPETPSRLPVLEPRLPSRFEPAGQDALGGGIERDVDVEAPPARHTGVRLHRESPHASLQQPSQTQGEQARKPDRRVSAVRSALDAAIATIQIPASSITPIDPSQPSQAMTDAPTARGAKDSSLDTARSADARSRTDHQITPLYPAPSPTSIVRPDVRVVSPESRAPGRESHEETPGAEPTIHVTIGRVDVRAVMAGVTPPTRPAPRSNKFSLEDYLRGRNRGVQ